MASTSKQSLWVQSNHIVYLWHSHNKLSSFFNTVHKVVCTVVDQNLIADQRNFGARYLQNGEKNWTKSRSISFYHVQYRVIFLYTDLISSLLDPRLVDPGLTLIYVGAYDAYLWLKYYKWSWQKQTSIQPII